MSKSAAENGTAAYSPLLDLNQDSSSITATGPHTSYSTSHTHADISLSSV